MLAWSEDTTGGERYTIRFKDLETGRVLPEGVEGTSGGVAWANDGEHVVRVFWGRGVAFA
jgi:oligopeptidase B